MPTSRQELFAYLDNLGITHQTEDHAPIFTVDDGQDIKIGRKGAQTKNLFLKGKAGRLFLICAEARAPIKINKLHPLLGCKRLSFGKPDLLLAHLGVTPGSVTLFSVINDKDNAVTLVIDKALVDSETVNFHPLLNTATTAISSSDMIKFAKATAHDPVVLDFLALNVNEDAPS